MGEDLRLVCADFLATHCAGCKTKIACSVLCYYEGARVMR